MAFAIDVRTRLWMAGAVSTSRDRKLIDCLFQHVRACCQFVQGLLVCTDGFAVYPKSVVRAFREKVKRTAGRGRCCLEAWTDLCIATVIKRTEKMHVVEVERKLTRGAEEKAQELLSLDKGCKEFNTSFIESLNATFRERLASLSHKCRHAAARVETLERGMYLVGCTYNFCFPHHELSKSNHFGYQCTKASAAGLTDHIWSVRELFMYKIAPDPWVEPKRAKRRKQSTPDSEVQKQRIRATCTHPLPDQTVPKQSGEVA